RIDMLTHLSDADHKMVSNIWTFLVGNCSIIGPPPARTKASNVGWSTPDQEWLGDSGAQRLTPRRAVALADAVDRDADGGHPIVAGGLGIGIFQPISDGGNEHRAAVGFVWPGLPGKPVARLVGPMAQGEIHVGRSGPVHECEPHHGIL